MNVEHKRSAIVEYQDWFHLAMGFIPDGSDHRPLTLSYKLFSRRWAGSKAKTLSERMLVTGLITGSAFLLIPPQAVAMTGSDSLVFAHAVLRQIVHGHLNGVYQGVPNGADFRGLKPGDVLLCRDSGGGYGYFTHAAVYVGGDLAVEANGFARGTALCSEDHFRQYDEVVALRFPVAGDVGQRIAQSALREVGKPYDPLARMEDGRSEYCSKLVWRVFAQNGLVLCRPRAWIVPDDLLRSGSFRRVNRWASSQMSNGRYGKSST